MQNTRIKSVRYKTGYLMDIQLQNGHGIVYNMYPKLITARFRDLEDWNVFCSGHVMENGKVIRWNDNTELSMEEIFLNIKD